MQPDQETQRRLLQQAAKDAMHAKQALGHLFKAMTDLAKLSDTGIDRASTIALIKAADAVACRIASAAYYEGYHQHIVDGQ